MITTHTLDCLGIKGFGNARCPTCGKRSEKHKLFYYNIDPPHEEYRLQCISCNVLWFYDRQRRTDLEIKWKN